VVRGRGGDGPVMPPLGDEHEPKRTCTRLIGRNDDGSERLCDEPAIVHIDWGPNLGFACEAHAAELNVKWKAEDHHPLGSACGMPGSLWYWASFDDERTSWCAIPGDGLPVVETAAEAVA
jgi:hypothetical protein